MNTHRLAIASASLLPLSLAACVSQAHPPSERSAEDYRISVEIPLEALHVADAELLKVDELLNERTGFDADDFQLDEVVLIARSDAETAANAELLVLEWRSGQVHIPPGGDEDWFEVRVPAPEEDNGGAWLLDITGAATVNLLVAVLEPRPRIVEEVASTAKTRTVYNTRVVYRDRVHPRSYHSYWIYEPSRYYTVHYHGVWPYRYFIGAWDTRYYDLDFRPYRFHYGPLYRPRVHGRAASRHRHGAPRAARPSGRDIAAHRRISPRLVQLRRSHPRLRTLHQRQTPRRPNASGGHFAEPTARRSPRMNEPRRTHTSPRAFHSAQRRGQAPSNVAEPSPIHAARRPSGVSRQRAAPERRSNARPAPTSTGRIRQFRQAAQRPTTSARPPAAQDRPLQSNVRTRQLRRTPPPAQPARRPAVTRRAPASRPNVRTRSFERQALPSTPPRQANQAPTRRRSVERPVRRADPGARPSAPSRHTVFERR